MIDNFRETIENNDSLQENISRNMVALLRYAYEYAGMEDAPKRAQDSFIGRIRASAGNRSQDTEILMEDWDVIIAGCCKEIAEIFGLKTESERIDDMLALISQQKNRINELESMVKEEAHQS